MRVAALLLLAMVPLGGQGVPQADAFARAREATWAVSVLRYTSSGQVEFAAFVGSGFFVSRNHFVTAEHVLNATLLGRTRNMRDRIRIFKTSPYDTGYSAFKVVYEDNTLDIAILEMTLATQDWLDISTAEPREGEAVGSYGYPLVEFSNLRTATAFALGRLGIVAGYGRDAGARRMITTLQVTTGNSGGPVFLMGSGQVVAVQKAQMTDSKGTDVAGYAVSTPLSAILPALQKLGIVK
jgi:S1-C subfamily serine protease